MTPPGRPRRPATSTLLALAAAVALVASLVPVPGGGDVPAAGPAGVAVGVDKWLHAAGYAVLGALAVGDRRERAGDTGRPSAVELLAVVAAVTAFGAGIEAVQAVVPGRTASGADAVANAVGAAVGVGGAVAWLAVRRRGRERPTGR